jgi:putative lipoic acid-binding regulatory protein
MTERNDSKPSQEVENAALKYPQRVPLKVIGDNDDALLEALNITLARHLEDGTTIDFRTNKSRHGTYVSVTATFVASSRKQLEDMYTELRECEVVRFLL